MNFWGSGKFDFDKVKCETLLQCFFFTILISLSPFKILSYFIPVFLSIFIILKLFSKNLHRKIFLSLLIFLVTIGFYQLKSFYFNYDFSLFAAVLSILTYGSIIFVLIYPRFTSHYDSPETIRLHKFIYVIFVIETVIAILQLVIFILLNSASLDESTGDIIQGSINPLSFLSSNVGFNNQVFTINYIFLLIYEIPYLLKTKRKYLIFIGVIVIMLASVLHVVLSFLLALFTSFLLVGIVRFRKQVARFCLMGAFLVIVLFFTQPKNFSLFSLYFNSLSSEQSPKVFVIANSIALLPQDYPDALFLGLGPGQYTSRASLISSGHYFGDFEKPTKLPLLTTPLTSKAFNDYVFDIWELYATNVERYGNSTMSRPFFSIFTLFMEFGIILFLLVLVILLRRLIKMRKRCLQLYNENTSTIAYYSFISMTSILFIVFLSFFENYLESSASICSGLLLIRYFNSIKV